jgi:septum formation protein
VEIPQSAEDAQSYVARVAREKAEDVASRLTECIILSADTEVSLDGDILGKPADADEAVRMLRKLSGRCHSVYTALCVINQGKAEMLEGLEETRVWFDALSDEEIRDYVRRENVLDKAGGYAIQGYAGIYIPRIEGNYFNVMGLPLPLVHRLLCRTSS